MTMTELNYAAAEADHDTNNHNTEDQPRNDDDDEPQVDLGSTDGSEEEVDDESDNSKVKSSRGSRKDVACRYVYIVRLLSNVTA